MLILTTFRNKKPPINLYFPETALNFTQNKLGPVEYTWEENPAEYFQYTPKIFLNRCTQFRRARIVLKWGSYFAYFNHFPKQKTPINLYFPETALNFTQNKPGPVEYTWEENPAEYFQYTPKIFLNRCTQFRRARIVLKWGSYFAYFNHFPKQKTPINLYFPETALNFTQNKPGPVEYTWEENPAEYFQYAPKIFLNRCRQFRRARIVLKWGSYFAYFNHFPKQKTPINLYFPETALNFTQNKPGPVEYTWEENPAEYFQYTPKIFLNRCKQFRYAEIFSKWF